MDTYRSEILEQPAALRRLADYYADGEGRDLLRRLPRPHTLLLAGMGASYHAAWASTYYAHSLHLRAAAVEATDLVYYSGALLAAETTLVYLSQSGESGEVAPV